MNFIALPTDLVLSLADEYARRFEQFKDFPETPRAIRWMLEPRDAMEKVLAGQPADKVEMDSWHPEDPENPSPPAPVS